MNPTVDEFKTEVAEWLAQAVPEFERDHPRSEHSTAFSVAVFHALSFDEEREVLNAIQRWNQKRAERGYHAITWPVEYGGRGLSKEHARAYSQLEQSYRTGSRHETFSVTTGLMAPTVERFGTPEQKASLVARFLRADDLCCQLFSEPGAGSDLASLACRAERDGDEWVVNGQKVWSSGAQFSEWGELIVRTDPDIVKHKGLTAFIIPMDLPGIEIRQIKQMSGGTSFNEVFFTDVRVPDSMRLGGVGDGWNVALTTLGFERDHSDGKGDTGVKPGGSWEQLLATARTYGREKDPMVRKALSDAYIRMRVEKFVSARAADLRAAGAPPGPEGSLGKLLWTEGMTEMANDVSLILGPHLIADVGADIGYAWGEHVLGAPGYRIAGGSDEVQRNIIGERVLGLPTEPRVDKGTWKETLR